MCVCVCVCVYDEDHCLISGELGEGDEGSPILVGVTALGVLGSLRGVQG